VLRIGTIWGPLVDPESPFFYIPPYISAVLRGDEPQSLYADDGGDCCYAPDAGRAIALLTTAQTLRHDSVQRSAVHQPRVRGRLGRDHPGSAARDVARTTGGPRRRPYLDITRLTQDTGFEPTFDIAAAVADYVAWRADNRR
jgi:nucleoside-diphosphate-sugar epimerase